MDEVVVYPWQEKRGLLDDEKVFVDTNAVVKENAELKSACESLATVNSKLGAELRDAEARLHLLTQISEDCQAQLQIARAQLETAREQLQQAARDEIVFPVLVNAIISKKQGLIGDAKAKMITDGVMLWINQRARVVRYLRDNALFPEAMRKLESILFITEDELTASIRKYTI